MSQEAPMASRGPYAKSAERRRRIVEAAVDVFSEGGYRSGSLREVAERAGLSHPGLLHHFPSKVELLRAVLEWRDGHALEQIRIGERRGAELVRAYLRFVEDSLATPHLIDLHVRLSAEATGRDHPAHDYFVQRYEGLVRLLDDALADAQDLGEAEAGIDRMSVARQFIALVDGLQIQWLLDPLGTDVAGEVRRFAQQFICVQL